MHEWLILDRETGVQVDKANSVIMAEYLAMGADKPVAYRPYTGDIIYY